MDGLIVRGSADVSESITNKVYIRKHDNIVQLSINDWEESANITIPSIYRPSRLATTIAEQKTGSSGTIEFRRCEIKTDGSIKLSSTNDRLLGHFVWITDN